MYWLSLSPMYSKGQAHYASLTAATRSHLPASVQSVTSRGASTLKPWVAVAWGLRQALAGWLASASLLAAEACSQPLRGLGGRQQLPQGQGGGGREQGQLTLLPLDKMAVISQTTSLNIFSWMKMYEFRLKFHWSLFLRVQLTIFQHWFR